MLKTIYAECPCCGANQDHLQEDDVIDTYLDNNKCVITITGYCDECETNLVWEDVYEISERMTNLRED
jgi:hypothetical protein